MKGLKPIVCQMFIWLGVFTAFSGSVASGIDPLRNDGEGDDRWKKELVLHPDCEIELVAQEPQVIDPIAVRFDEKGRMWVVEMRDYPTLNQKRPQSTIKILQDKDQDGYFETATVFAQHLKFPTGIQPWRNGVIATLEGQIVYLADNDGDLRCDEERILFSGFAAANTQLRANHPTFGPDGKIYVANGLRNGKIKSTLSLKEVSLTGMDFRFDPITLDFETVTGHGQFGMTFDAAANRYVCTNRNPLKRIVFEAEYLKSGSGVRVSQTVVDVAAAGPDSRLYPISETWTTSNLHANQFTAACGVHIYGGTRLPGEMVGNAFTCDPTANAVHREIISYKLDSVVGTSTPARVGIEFLASKNPKFRPVNLNEGPDGSLYVVDMRRNVIEHPQFMPPELKNRPDLRKGNDQGRIYRIRSRSSSDNWKMRKIDPEKDLFDRSSWWREQAHRVLMQNPEAVDVEQVRQGLSRPESHPNGLIRALSLLRTRKQLRPIDYQFAINHYASSVRAYSMRMCEGNHTIHIERAITDESDQVRFQALLSCAKVDINLSAEQLEVVASYSAQNRWVKQAWLMAAQPRANELLETLTENLIRRSRRGLNHSHIIELCQGLIPLALKSDPARTLKTAVRCLDNVSAKELDLELLSLSFLKVSQLRNLIFKSDEVDWGALRSFLSRMVKQGNIQVGNDADARMELLGIVAANSTLIDSLALTEKVPSLRLAALKALQYSKSSNAWIELVSRFRSLSFEERNEVMKACLSRAEVAEKLLKEIDGGRLKVSELGISFRKRLLAHSSPEIKRRAAKVLAIRIPADRQKAFETYKVALNLKADAKRGKPLFEKNCAACHRLGTLGNQIGPDISDTRTKSKSQLLLDIIRPNAAIDNNYVEYLIATIDGRMLKGILLENNSTGITIRQADNQRVVIAAEDIEKIQSTGKSLMPVGLEQGMTPQQVADLISYLQNWRYLEQNIPYSEERNAK